MLKELSVKNFTAFGRASLELSDGLNIIVGENGTGKTHLLKLGYLLSGIWHAKVSNRSLTSKEEIEKYIAERLINLFKPEKIGNLARSEAKNKTEISGIVQGTIPTVSITAQGEESLPPMPDVIEWQFSSRYQKNVSIDQFPKRLTSNALYGNSVYLPSKEMISFFEGFLSLYETHQLQFDETFRDLALALSSPKLKEKPELLFNLLDELGNAVGGEIVLEGGRFYTASGSKDKKREVTLLAEGLRKLATIIQLIENGSLKSGDSLFWDEPEANLNPRLIKLVAETMLHLCRSGIQVMLATHSLFLLRELEILSSASVFQNIPIRYFALKPASGGVKVTQGNSIEDIDPLVMLDESLQQSDRFLAMDGGYE